MTALIKCPRDRTVTGDKCLRPGCQHRAGVKRRICGCCAVQLGTFDYNKLNALSMRKYSREAYLAFEVECVARLSRMPWREPVGRDWPPGTQVGSSEVET